jgi:hypothetical protein
VEFVEMEYKVYSPNICEGITSRATTTKLNDSIDVDWRLAQRFRSALIYFF